MIEDLRQRDIKHLWHPYTEISSFEESDFPIIESAKGVHLQEVGGRQLLDGIASWWCVNLGHSHPRLVSAIRDQAEKLQHCILGSVSHPKAIELAERLAELAPGDLNHTYFACDGSSATEAALKVAIQYRVNTGEPERNRFIALAEGYHGDTLGAMGVGFVETFHRDFKNSLIPAYQADSPHCAKCPYEKEPRTCNAECFASMEQVIKKHAHEVTAVMVEPLCQGAAGIRIYSEKYLRKLRVLCDEHDLLLIADEIAVGFGRTGKLFACELAEITPDIMTIGKGLTGGYLPMSATIVTDKIYDTFRRDGDTTRIFYDGHTFGGNPITSAWALTALDVYEQENVLAELPPKALQLTEGMTKLKKIAPDSCVLTLGLIGVIELAETDGGIDRAKRIAKHAMDAGLFIRPLGAAIYLWPPLTISSEELQQMLDILESAFEIA